MYTNIVSIEQIKAGLITGAFNIKSIEIKENISNSRARALANLARLRTVA